MKKIPECILCLLLITLSSYAFSQDWFKATAEGCNCSILMPAEPAPSKRIINHPQYGKLTMNMVSLTVKDSSDHNMLYFLNYTDYPIGTIHSDSAAILDTYFETSKESAIANVQGTLLSETILDLLGYPGRELRISMKNGVLLIRCRNYLIKNRLYTLQVLSLAENNFNTSINKFLDSFIVAPK